MRQLAMITMSLRAGLGVQIDSGGEKVFVVDERGDILPGWKFLAAVATLAMQDRPGSTIAVPISAPNLFEQLATKYGGKVVRTRVNPRSLMAAAVGENVVLVGDGDGGLIFPEFHPAMDGLFAIAKTLELLNKHDVTLAEVTRSLPNYHLKTTKLPCPWEDKGKVMRLLSEQYQDPHVSQVEGVKIAWGDEWVLVLPDADRPVFHIIAESTSDDGAKVLMEKYAALVSSLQR